MYVPLYVCHLYVFVYAYKCMCILINTVTEIYVHYSYCKYIQHASMSLCM
jgi:hypothetical protein